MLGSAGVVAVVIGSSIAASSLWPDDLGLRLLQEAPATGAGLVALILTSGPASGGHPHPVVTLPDRVHGGVADRQVAEYLTAQLAGGVPGAAPAHLVFDLARTSSDTVAGIAPSVVVPHPAEESP